MAKLDEIELKALISSEISSAENYVKTELTASREKAINYFNGVMTDVPAIEGRSQYVSRDTSNVIGWALPGIIRVFTASDRIIDCLPESPEDDQATEQAADLINYTFWRENNGYKILWDATHDSLLAKDGIVKQYWDTAEKCRYSTHTGMTEDQVAILTAEEGVEIVAQSEAYYERVEPDQPPVTLYDLKIKRVTSKGQLKFEVVEPENFLIDRDAIDIEEARFIAHKVSNVTRSDLIKMGFKRERIEQLVTFKSTDWTDEARARRNDAGGTNDAGDKSMERVTLYECYIKTDVNDDGIAEAVRVYYAGDGGGGDILDWEEFDDETPFDKIPCNPVPHRFSSDSLADDTMDLQRFKTVLGRQMFDNLYLANMPQPIVESGSVENMDAVTNPGIGVPIITKAGRTPPIYNVVPFIGDKVLAAMDYLDGVIEQRTGVTKASATLDPDVLQNQSATAANIQQTASYSQIELIARNQAELGWKRVFAKSLRLIVKHQDRPKTIRLRNEWVEMDPRHWNTGMDIVVNVGLGTGSRDRDMMILGQILNSQIMITDRFAQSGFSEQAIDMVPKIVKTTVKLAEAAGVKSPETYYPAVEDEDVQKMKESAQQMAQQPDPKVMAEQAKLEANMQVEQAKLQSTMQLKQAEMQLNVQMEQARMAAARDKEMAQMQADVQVKHAEAEKAQVVENQRMQFEAAQFDRQQALEREKMAMDFQIAAMKIEHDTAVKAAQSDSQAVKGKDGKTQVKARNDVNNEAVMEALRHITEMAAQTSQAIAQMAQIHAAPTRLIRDENGRPIGTEKVIN